MTKSTITREQAEDTIEGLEGLISSGIQSVYLDMALSGMRQLLAAMDSEPVYQCEFCHADASGELQWHWEDVNKDFYEQYDSERRSQRRILNSAPQPAPEMAAIVERLNASGYEYGGGEVTPQNAAAVVDILLQQLDDAVQGQNTQSAPECEPVKRFNADQMHRICLEATRHFDKYGAMAMEVNKLLGRIPAQQPVVESEFIPKNLDKALGVVGVALPESKEEFNFQIERWIQRLIDRVIRYADEFKEQPASAARMVVIPTIWKHYTAAQTAAVYEKAMTDAGIEWRSIDD